jgi:hypothetical protein
METFGIILLVIGALLLFAGLGLVLMVALLYALITFLEGKEKE